MEVFTDGTHVFYIPNTTLPYLYSHQRNYNRSKFIHIPKNTYSYKLQYRCYEPSVLFSHRNRCSLEKWYYLFCSSDSQFTWDWFNGKMCDLVALGDDNKTLTIKRGEHWWVTPEGILGTNLRTRGTKKRTCVEEQTKRPDKCALIVCNEVNSFENENCVEREWPGVD